MKKRKAAAKGEHQNIARATIVLDALARASTAGLRLTDVVEVTGLNKATVHRVLSGLAAHQLAEQDVSTGRFLIGTKVLSWVTSAATRFNIAHLAEPSLTELAQITEDTVYFSVRSGTELVCIDRLEGSFPIKTLTLDIGERRPLGISAGGLALLAFLPDGEIEEILNSHRDRKIVFPFDEVALRAMIDRTRKTGFAYYDAPVIRGSDVISGMAAIALPIRSSDEKPVAAISVAALTERLQPPRQSKILESMKHAADHIESVLELRHANPYVERLIGAKTPPP